MKPGGRFERDEESPVSPVTYHTTATRIMLEASKAFPPRKLPSRLAEMFHQEALHQSGDEEEKDDDFSLEEKADSNQGVIEGEIEDGGTKEKNKKLLK